jgi:hypothetical protein
MKNFFTLGDKIWIILTILFLISIICLNNTIPIITLTIMYFLTYLVTIGITMLILNK